jgi:hypothetical protein
MHAALLLLRLNSQAMSAVMGGFAVFCLFCTIQAPNPDVVRYLLIEALKWGGLATIIVYFQGKYLDR